MDYLFDDVFVVRDIDMDGKKFDRVSRIKCRSENYEMDLILDIVNEMYPLAVDERFHCVLSHSLTPTGKGGSVTAEEGFYDPELFKGTIGSGGMNLADKFDYVMYGKIYKAEEATASKVAIYVSFGGLLMRLEGDPRHWNDLKVGGSTYILIKKI